MAALRAPEAEPFSLVRGGAFEQLARVVAGDRAAERFRRLRPIVLPALTWLPLLILTGLNGVLVGQRVRIPFLFDFAVHVRFLLVLPILLIAENMVDPWLAQTLGEFQRTGTIAAADEDRFAGLIRRTRRVLTSPIVEPLLLAAAYLLEILGFRVTSVAASSWLAAGHLPRTWFLLVSMPIYQFIVLRWLWRFLVWAQLLWGVARLKLLLDAAHADLLGGLGVVNVGHSRLAIVLFALSMNVAAQLGEQLVFDGVSLAQLRTPIIGFSVVGAIFMMSPLLVFNRQLLRTKDAGLMDYGAFAYEYARAFRRKWVEKPGDAGAEALGSSDIQSLADIGNAFQVVKRMRITMWERRVLVPFGLGALLPMAPLLLAEVPLSAVAKALAKVLA